MSNSAATDNTAQTSSGIETVGLAANDALIGFAALGKTAAALALIIVIIVACSALLRRFQLRQQPGGARLRVISATAVGPKERVVIVEAQDTWLVLGVGGGQVTKLHEMPAPGDEERVATAAGSPTGAGFAPGDSFATRFAKALKHNTGLGRKS